MNTGQACCAGTRIFVQEGVYDKVIEAMKGTAEYWKGVTGDPFSSKTQMGPIVSKVQIDVSCTSPLFFFLSH
jgi:aldehyde dehydrogenase (NAD+)